MQLSRSQKIIKFLNSAENFKKIEEESKKWIFHCSSCKKTFSIWDIGGVRHKAKGNPKLKMKCPHCGVSELRVLKYKTKKK